MALLERAYFWPHMGDDVEEYVRTCLTCQQDKRWSGISREACLSLYRCHRERGSLNYLDFISALPKVGGYGSILVVVDRFSKYATLIPAPKHCTAEEAAHLFFKHVVKHWGVPQTIVSDRDGRFTGRFWTELFQLLGSKLNFSSSMHAPPYGAGKRSP